MNIATLVAVTGNQHGGGLGTVIGLAIVAIVVLVAGVRFTILDIIDNRARKIGDAVYAEMRAENDPKLARDWQLFAAEYQARLAARRAK
jgi:uncharacterized membrane protein